MAQIEAEMMHRNNDSPETRADREIENLRSVYWMLPDEVFEQVRGRLVEGFRQWEDGPYVSN